MSLVTAFQLHLGDKVSRGLAAAGVFDASSSTGGAAAASIAAAGPSGRAFVCCPAAAHGDAHASATPSQSTQQLAWLGAGGRKVTALAAGALVQASGSCANSRDALVIGTAGALQAYDFESNRDLFHRDVPEGAACAAAGLLGGHARPLALAGGDCAVRGFYADGRAALWAAVGGSVAALALADIDGDGANELLVGCDDATITVLRGDGAAAAVVTEAGAVVGLAPCGGRRFGYALTDGTVGVYAGGSSNGGAVNLARLWRVKSRHGAALLAAFPAAAEGDELSLVTGWPNGRVEARCAATGRVTHRDALGAPVAALLAADMRGVGSRALVAVGANGEARGYVPRDAGADGGDGCAAGGSGGGGGSGLTGGGVAAQQRALADLAAQKHELLRELAFYEGGGGGGSGANGGSGAAVRVDARIVTNAAERACELHLEAHGGGGSGGAFVIKAALLFGERLFPGGGEALLSAPVAPSPRLTVRLAPARDAAGAALAVKALVGPAAAAAYEVHELALEVPRYALYAPAQLPPAGTATGTGGAAPSSLEAAAARLGRVVFEARAPLQRVAAWVADRFGAPPAVLRPDGLEAYVTALRDGQLVGVTAAAVTGAGAGSGTKPLETPTAAAAAAATAAAGAQPPLLRIAVLAADAGLAGELVADLAAALGLAAVASRAHFPVAADALGGALVRARELDAARGALAADAAAGAGAVKTLVVAAEAARLLGDMPGLRRACRRLRDVNGDLARLHELRLQQHDDLMAALRDVNRGVQRAARLRVGAPAAAVTAACRAAVAAGDPHALAAALRDDGGGGLL